jgi:ribonuclease BN (tRNA processing enzyme)
VIVDAGTGVFALGNSLTKQPSHFHILFSHVHWDHVQGLPFFAPLRDPTVQVSIYGTARCLPLLRALLTQELRGIYIPTPLEQLKAQLNYHAFRIGESFVVGELKIDTVVLNHPYLSVGFRFQANGRSAVFFSDTAPFTDILFGYEYRPRPPRPDEALDEYEKERLAELEQAAIDLCHQTDLLIFDGHFTPQEYPRFAHFGHSTPEHALDIARRAQVKQLAIFHHAPARTDAQLDAILAEYQPLARQDNIELSLAREGVTVKL